MVGPLSPLPLLSGGAAGRGTTVLMNADPLSCWLTCFYHALYRLYRLYCNPHYPLLSNNAAFTLSHLFWVPAVPHQASRLRPREAQRGVAGGWDAASAGVNSSSTAWSVWTDDEIPSHALRAMTGAGMSSGRAAAGSTSFRTSSGWHRWVGCLEFSGSKPGRRVEDKPGTCGAYFRSHAAALHHLLPPYASGAPLGGGLRRGGGEGDGDLQRAGGRFGPGAGTKGGGGSPRVPFKGLIIPLPSLEQHMETFYLETLRACAKARIQQSEQA